MVRVPVAELLRLYERTDPPEVMTVERFLLAHGREYEPQRRPKGIRRRRGMAQLVNAYLLAAKRGFVYAEGFGVKPNDPRRLIHHAWCVDEAGRVIDPTWEEPKACDYFGIAFRSDFIARVTREHRYFAGVLMPHGYFDPRPFQGVEFQHQFSPPGGDPGQATVTVGDAGSSKGR